MTGENNMELETMDTNFSKESSEETHRPHTFSDRPSSSYRKAGVRLRPRLRWMKSFPPYSEYISSDTKGQSGPGVSSPHGPGSDEEMNETKEVFQSSDREEALSKQRRMREEVRAKWRERRMRRLGASPEGGTEEEEGLEKMNDEGEMSEWTRNEDAGAETRRKREENHCETPEQTPVRHPSLSKLLHSSSSSSSSCSSINFTSVESDDVFSEAEDVSKKRKNVKYRSWKTFFSMFYWSMRRQSSWVQVAGHQGNFQLSGGEVLKLYNDEEARCLDCLMSDSLRPFVPQYHGTVTRGEHCYMRLEDLLQGLKRPGIMDCKMGIRTFQEEELVRAQSKATLRSDMYQKMLKIDPSSLSAEEHAQRGVTKCRYLQWRDTSTTTSTLGFRIEAISVEDKCIQRDFRNIQSLAEVMELLLGFTKSQLDILKAYHSRLLAISEALMNSHFFKNHEVIGSSLLFVHDHSLKASVWMIDFGKTTPVRDTVKLQHNTPWLEGNREDGYLIGLTSLISALSQAISVVSRQQEERTDHMIDTEDSN